MAAKRKRAPADSANMGSVLLDEIAELPLALQTQLLSLLQGGSSDEPDESQNPAAEQSSDSYGLPPQAEEGSQDGVILIDAEGKVAHINDVAANLIEIDATKANQQSFEILSSHAPAFIRICRELKKFREGSRSLRRIELDLNLFGQDRTFLINPMVLTEGKFASGVLFILQDLSSVRDRDRARINLVGTLSRELRTPLTSIGLAAQLLEQGLIRRPKLTKILLAEFMRLSHLADELVDAAGEHRILNLAIASAGGKKSRRSRTKRKFA